MLLTAAVCLPRVFWSRLSAISAHSNVDAIDWKQRGSGGRRGNGWSESRKRGHDLFPGQRKYAVAHVPPTDVVVAEEVVVKKERPQIPFPKDIVAYLDSFVIGQDSAKKTLAVGVYQHYKRVEYNETNEERQFLKEMLEEAMKRKGPQNEMGHELRDLRKRRASGFKLAKDAVSDIVMEKSNVVLLGPSGSGKTYLTMRLAEALHVPIAMCDCTTLTQAGYVGEDVESVIQRLLVNANGDVQATERGIVFLDEFDKIYTSADPMHTSGNRDVGGKGVQQALLKLVEGTRVLVKNPLTCNQKVEIDTSNILFVASGAFSNLERIVARRLDQRALGFTASASHLAEALDARDETLAATTKSHLLSLTDHSDLIQFGMVPELVGRFPVLVPFHSLNETMLKQVLTEPRNNIVDQAKQLFLMDKIKLEFTDCAIKEMAVMAMKRRTGARALRSILEKVLLPAKYDCPGSEPGTVVINGAVVRGEAEYSKTTRGHSPSDVIAK